MYAKSHSLYGVEPGFGPSQLDFCDVDMFLVSTCQLCYSTMFLF